jgi:hypothetical protein
MKVTVTNKSHNSKDIGERTLDSKEKMDLQIEEDQLDKLREDADLQIYIHKRRTNDREIM